MKRLLLFVTIISMSLGLNSCSDDDSNPAQQQDQPTAISYKEYGNLKTSNSANIIVTQGEGGTWLQVTTTANNDSNSKIYLQLYQGQTGTGKAEMVYFQNLGSIPSQFTMSGLNDPNFTINITRNDSEVLSGIFSGTLWFDSQNGDDMPVQLTEGTFYINR